MQMVYYTSVRQFKTVALKPFESHMYRHTYLHIYVLVLVAIKLVAGCGITQLPQASFVVSVSTLMEYVLGIKFKKHTFKIRNLKDVSVSTFSMLSLSNVLLDMDCKGLVNL